MCPVTPPWTLILLLSSVPSLAEDLVSFGSNITMCSSLFNNLVRLRTPYSLNSLLSRLSFPLLIALPLSFSTTGILYIWLCTVCISIYRYMYMYYMYICMYVYIFHLSIRTNFCPFGGDIIPVENAWSRCINFSVVVTLKVICWQN